MARLVGGLLFVLLVPTVLGNSLNLRIHYPESQLNSSDAGLFIRGDGCGLNWDSGLAVDKSGTDQWEISVDCAVAPANNTLEFKVLVGDATWQLGANSMVLVPSSGDATFDSYPWFTNQNGEYTYIRNVHSKELGNSRDIVVYTPPSYLENTLKVHQNVLIMHDGQNLFNQSTAFMGNAWLCQDTVDLLVMEGHMEEIVIIGVDNSPDRIDELTYSVDPTEQAGGKGDLYLDFVENEVLAAAKANYRIDVSSRENMGILGSSLGGLISCYAGWTRGHVYSRAGCMSSSFWWNSQDFNSTVIPNRSPPTNVTFYLDSGDQGPGADDKEETLTVLSDLEARGWTLGQDVFYYLDHGGMHSETYWGPRFHYPMSDLYPPKPHKTTVNTAALS